MVTLSYITYEPEYDEDENIIGGVETVTEDLYTAQDISQYNRLIDSEITDFEKGIYNIFFDCSFANKVKYRQYVKDKIIDGYLFKETRKIENANVVVLKDPLPLLDFQSVYFSVRTIDSVNDPIYQLGLKGIGSKVKQILDENLIFNDEDELVYINQSKDDKIIKLYRLLYTKSSEITKYHHYLALDDASNYELEYITRDNLFKIISSYRDTINYTEYVKIANLLNNNATRDLGVTYLMDFDFSKQSEYWLGILMLDFGYIIVNNNVYQQIVSKKSKWGIDKLNNLHNEFNEFFKINTSNIYYRGIQNFIEKYINISNSDNDVKAKFNHFTKRLTLTYTKRIENSLNEISNKEFKLRCDVLITPFVNEDNKPNYFKYIENE